MEITDALMRRKPAAMGDDEWRLRIELAACYRIFDHFGWTELIYNHITLRVPGSGDKGFAPLPDQPLRAQLQRSHRDQPDQGAQ